MKRSGKSDSKKNMFFVTKSKFCEVWINDFVYISLACGANILKIVWRDFTPLMPALVTVAGKNIGKFISQYCMESLYTSNASIRNGSRKKVTTN